MYPQLEEVWSKSAKLSQLYSDMINFMTEFHSEQTAIQFFIYSFKIRTVYIYQRNNINMTQSATLHLLRPVKERIQ